MENSEQAVIIQFNYGYDTLDPLHELDRKLENLIDQAGVGKYDWHEISMDNSHGFLYMHGPNAEILFKTIHPTLIQTDFMQGAIANLRFGITESGVREIDVPI